MRTRILPLLALAAVVVGCFALLGGGDDTRRVTMRLDNAAGLRDGSPVKIGGVDVGEVREVEITGRREVRIEMEVDPDLAPVRRDARVAITAANLLGEKYVELDPGRSGAPLAQPEISRARVATTVDLDQVLDTLDLPTRTRLAILINETARALGGRTRDTQSTIEALPGAFQDAGRLLDDLVGQNRVLEQAIHRSDRFVTALAGDRDELTRVVDRAGAAMTATAERRRELGATLERLPGTLASLNGFLGELDRTTGPLGSAARALTATSSPLERTLAELPGFERAARPALAKATEVSLLITSLAKTGTPVLDAARPTVASLQQLATDAPPLTHAADASIADILNTVEGWSRAIQTRDGLSHVFRGKASLSTDTLRTLVSRLTPPERKRRAKRNAAPRHPRDDARPELPPVRDVLPEPVRKAVPKVGEVVDRVLDRVLRPGGGQAPSRAPDQPLGDLLDFLLGD